MSGPAGAAATVGVVLAEAVVLYVGYGALSGIAGATILDALGDE